MFVIANFDILALKGQEVLPDFVKTNLPNAYIKRKSTYF